MLDVYNLYDLTNFAPSRPGDIEFIRVRSRSPQDARLVAARHAGREGREVWTDPDLSKCLTYGPALVQWSGVVTLRAHGAYVEGSRVDHVVGLDVDEPTLSDASDR